MRKCKKQHYVYYCYDDTSVIHTDGSMRPQNDNLKQGFGQWSKHGTSCICMQNNLIIRKAFLT